MEQKDSPVAPSSQKKKRTRISRTVIASLAGPDSLLRIFVASKLGPYRQRPEKGPSHPRPGKARYLGNWTGPCYGMSVWEYVRQFVVTSAI